MTQREIETLSLTQGLEKYVFTENNNTLSQPLT